MRQYNIYRLKGDIKPANWQLPIRSEFISKSVDGRSFKKRITYIPGAGTIFLEDYKGDMKQDKGIWFEEGELTADKDNFELNEILTKHRLYGRAYDIVDEEVSAAEGLKKYEATATASNMILNELDDDKLKAMAMILLGEDALSWGVQQSKGKLLKFANERPQAFLIEVDKPNYQSRYFAAQAIAKGIVAYNDHRTAIVWGDDRNGRIVTVAPGENPLEKLAELLENESESSMLVLQRIGERIEKAGVSTSAKSAAPVGKTEAQIRAEVEAELEKKYQAKLAALTSASAPSELDEARAKYKEAKGKEVPVNKKNDLDWIQSELSE